MENDCPMVTVAFMAYNQEKFIRESLESVLNQKTSFRVQIVIGEDCSTDGTRQIVQQYANTYSDKIQLVLSEHNLGMKGNLQQMRPFFIGKYIAPLDGGDYWLDEYKLQKQVEFLEDHPEFIAVATKMRVIDEKGARVNRHTFSAIYSEKETFTIADAQNYIMPGHVNTLLYRNYPRLKDAAYLEKYDICKANGDSKLTLALTLQGDIACVPEEMLCFRLIESGWTNTVKKKNINIFEYEAMNELTRFAWQAFGVKVDYSKAQMRAWFGACVWMCLHPSVKALQELKKIYFDGNNQLEKAKFLIIHIIAWPFRITSKYVLRRRL